MREGAGQWHLTKKRSGIYVYCDIIGTLRGMHTYELTQICICKRALEMYMYISVYVYVHASTDMFTYISYWPSANPATVPGWWVRDLMDVGWDLVVGLSGASGRQF